MADWILTAIVVIGVSVMLYRQHKLDKEGAATPKRPRQRPADPDDTRDWPAIVAKATEVAALQSKPCIALDIADGAVSEHPHSSIGGAPSLPPDMPWPADASGKPMVFLAQLNFGDLPELDGYPTEGLLSFFVMDEDVQGCEFPSVGNQGFAVIYQVDTSGLTRRTPPDGFEYVPMSTKLAKEGRPLTGRAAMGPLTVNGMEVTEMTKDWYPGCPNDLWDEFGEGLLAAKPSPLYFGGHPDFIQYDIRRAGADPDYTAYTEVLLQMGFIHDRDSGAEVCWGDAGEACFLITKDDLANRRFDQVAYSWDCG